MWKKIGHRPVENFSYPCFLSTFYNQTTGEAGIWYLIDENGSYYIRPELPEEFKGFEFEVALHPKHLIERIETGMIAFPYGNLIKYNRFVPTTQPREITLEERPAGKRECGSKNSWKFCG